MSVEWLFDAVSEQRTRITQRIVLAGDNAAVYVKQVQDGFGATLPDGMKKIADAMVRPARSTATTALTFTTGCDRKILQPRAKGHAGALSP